MSLPQVIRTYFKTGELQEEFFEINYKKEGEYKRYYKNGNIWKIFNYVNGKLNGEYKGYYKRYLQFKEKELDIDDYNYDGCYNSKLDFWITEKKEKSLSSCSKKQWN